MGINAFALNMISSVLMEISHRPVKLLSLGYPDILLPTREIESILGDKANGLKDRPDSESILRWHNREQVIEMVPDSHDFFSRLGVELCVTDFQEVRGDELICDLNQPLESEFYNQFDLVFDGGTLEHCFHVAQAAINILGMAKVGGYIIHSNPLVLINHGFYNFSPTFYYDFYVQNGHQLASGIIGSQSDATNTDAWVLHPVDRLHDPKVESAISVVVKKLNDNTPSFPVQSKYRRAPKLVHD